MSSSDREYQGRWRGHRSGGSRSENVASGRDRKWSENRNERASKPVNIKDDQTDGRRKSYQEVRRQDRDRRDRRNERISSGHATDDYYDKPKLDNVKTKDEKTDNKLTHSGRGGHESDKRYSTSEKPHVFSEKKYSTRPQYTDRYDKEGKSKGESSRPFSKEQHKRHELVRDRGDIQQKLEKQDGHSETSDKTIAGREIREPENKEEKNNPDLMNLLQHNTSKKPSPTEPEPFDGDIKSKGMSAANLEKQWQKEEEERKKKEQEEKQKLEELERKRLEEEKKIKEEEESKRKEEEEAERLREEELKIVQDFIRSTTESIELKLLLREKNRVAAENYPDDSFFSRLDSSLKKNTAFVKKVKNLTETQKDALTKDFNSLNLTKYIGELASAITEAKLKMSDIGCALHLSSLAHRRYAEFSASLLESWQKVLLSKKDEKVPNPSKLRVDFRFFADLVMCGVFTEKEGLPVLANQLMLLTNNDKDEHNNLSIIISFCKHCGDDYAGLISKKYSMLAEKHGMTIPRSNILPEERKKGCSKLIREYYTSLCTHLLREHKDLKSIEKQNRKILQTKGELGQDRKDQYESAHQIFHKLFQNTTTLADLLDEEVPPLPVEKMETEEEMMGIDFYSPENEYVYDGENALYDDEDTRQFYENLPDLKSIVPQILYKDSEQAPKPDKTNEESTLEDEELNVEDFEKEMEKGQKESEITAEDEPPPSPLELEEDDFDIATSMRQILDAFLGSLPTCVNRDLIDKAAIDFCMNMNTKANRKKLVKTLFTVQRTRYDLLPFYARLVASLHPCMPEIASDLMSLLKGDFRWHVRKKDQINIESKLKTVRFIGELVKFKMFPKAEALHCVKMLLFDFSHHNIEMACSLLETCGRFLYRSVDSHHRTKIYLDVMMRKKAALHLDQRYSTLIENAFYYSNPPESKKEVAVQLPPMHQYIRRLMYRDLSKITTEKILRQMRKLDWDDNDVCSYASKCLTAIWNVRYNVIHCCANLLAGLASYYENIAIAVVDGVIEDIRLGLEVNHPKYNQRRVSTVKYLGELYNYRLVESSVIFKSLYSFITFGVIYDDNVVSPLDPPEHLFRLRLAGVLLDTCGQYFDRGSSKKKLDCYLVYLQHYYWHKRKNPVWTAERPFPVEMEYSYHETLEILRPKLKFSKSYEEASSAVEQLEKEIRAKLAEVLPQKDESFSMQMDDNDGTLSTIKEAEELEGLSQNMSQLIGSDVMTPHSQSQESEDGCRGTQQSDSQSQSQHIDMDDSEEQSGEKGFDEDHSDSASDISTGNDEEEELNVLTGGPKVIKCVEDDDFMTSFDKMLSDNIQNRMQESTKVPSLDIAVPMHIKSQKAKYYVPGEDDVEEEEPDISGIKFVLMTRKGNKQQFSNLSVPVSEKFAAEYKEREHAEKIEKERMKRVVLNIHERQEEEDYQELMASMSRPVGPNVVKHEPRPRQYQHPKGAPDADLIFGSKLQQKTASTTDKVELEEIVLKDVPQQISNSKLKSFLKDHGVQLKGIIRMRYDNRTKQKGAYIDYTERHCFAVKPVSPPLPVLTELEGHNIKIYHASQQVCHVCKKPGHRHGTSECPAYLHEDNASVIPFQGHLDCFSNFYPCNIKVFGREFGSSEIAYQWRKARDLGYNELAQRILHSKHAGEAKYLSNNIDTKQSDEWEKSRVNIMLEILEAKVVHCDWYRMELKNSGTNVIAEATSDKFWGTGLFKQDTLRTEPMFWPGENTLGKMHMKLRQRIRNGEFDSKVNSNNSNNESATVVEASGWFEEENLDTCETNNNVGCEIGKNNLENLNDNNCNSREELENSEKLVFQSREDWNDDVTESSLNNLNDVVYREFEDWTDNKLEDWNDAIGHTPNIWGNQESTKGAVCGDGIGTSNKIRQGSAKKGGMTLRDSHNKLTDKNFNYSVKATSSSWWEEGVSNQRLILGKAGQETLLNSSTISFESTVDDHTQKLHTKNVIADPENNSMCETEFKYSTVIEPDGWEEGNVDPEMYLKKPCSHTTSTVTDNHVILNQEGQNIEAAISQESILQPEFQYLDSVKPYNSEDENVEPESHKLNCRSSEMTNFDVINCPEGTVHNFLKSDHEIQNIDLTNVVCQETNLQTKYKHSAPFETYGWDEKHIKPASYYRSKLKGPERTNGQDSYDVRLKQDVWDSDPFMVSREQSKLERTVKAKNRTSPHKNKFNYTKNVEPGGWEEENAAIIDHKEYQYSGAQNQRQDDTNSVTDCYKIGSTVSFSSVNTDKTKVIFGESSLDYRSSLSDKSHQYNDCQNLRLEGICSDKVQQNHDVVNSEEDHTALPVHCDNGLDHVTNDTVSASKAPEAFQGNDDKDILLLTQGNTYPFNLTSMPIDMTMFGTWPLDDITSSEVYFSPAFIPVGFPVLNPSVRPPPGFEMNSNVNMLNCDELSSCDINISNLRLDTQALSGNDEAIELKSKDVASDSAS